MGEGNFLMSAFTHSYLWYFLSFIVKTFADFLIQHIKGQRDRTGGYVELAVMFLLQGCGLYPG